MNERAKSKCEQCIIRQFNAMRAMTREELSKVSQCKEVRTVKKGEIIFKEGDALNGVFCVNSGISKLSKLSENGKSQIVKLAGKGEILGQRSLIAREEANLTAEAIDDMEVCFISKEHILEPLDRNNEYSTEMLRHLANELKEADDVIVNMSHKSVKQRMAACILYMNDMYGSDSEGFLNLVLSREDIADIVGTATESAIRMISDFKKQGLINTMGKRIKIVDFRKLQSMAQ